MVACAHMGYPSGESFDWTGNYKLCSHFIQSILSHRDSYKVESSISNFYWGAIFYLAGGTKVGSSIVWSYHAC